MFGKSNIPSLESVSDEELMKLVCKGNKQAFELLYDRYFDKLVAFARTFTGDTQVAEDAVQESFMKIIENPQQFDVQKKFSTWIYSVTGNACRNILRNSQNRSRILAEKSLMDTGEQHSPHQHMDYRNMLGKINVLYAEMNDKDRGIFSLRFEHELSIKEIAEIINIPEGSVKSGLYYLLKKMSYQLKEFTNDQ